MALIHDIARLAATGLPRDDIAAQVLVSRQTLDWLMDSDSFLVVLEQVGAQSEGLGLAPTLEEGTRVCGFCRFKLDKCICGV